MEIIGMTMLAMAIVMPFISMYAKDKEREARLNSLRDRGIIK